MLGMYCKLLQKHHQFVERITAFLPGIHGGELASSQWLTPVHKVQETQLSLTRRKTHLWNTQCFFQITVLFYKILDSESLKQLK